MPLLWNISGLTLAFNFIIALHEGLENKHTLEVSPTEVGRARVT